MYLRAVQGGLPTASMILWTSLMASNLHFLTELARGYTLTLICNFVHNDTHYIATFLDWISKRLYFNSNL